MHSAAVFFVCKREWGAFFYEDLGTFLGCRCCQKNDLSILSVRSFMSFLGVSHVFSDIWNAKHGFCTLWKTCHQGKKQQKVIMGLSKAPQKSSPPQPKKFKRGESDFFFRALKHKDITRSAQLPKKGWKALVRRKTDRLRSPSGYNQPDPRIPK